jgi:hypothetical protein
MVAGDDPHVDPLILLTATPVRARDAQQRINWNRPA